MSRVVARPVSKAIAAASTAASACALLVACAEEPPAAIGPGIYPALETAEMMTLGAPGPQDVPFAEALAAYSHALGRLHAFEPTSRQGIADEIGRLAAVLDRVPAAGSEPVLRATAARMRAVVERKDASAEDDKRALAAAATALLPVAQNAYRGSPDVVVLVRAFADAVSAVDAARDPPDLAGMLDALLRAERALAAMYAADVATPL